MQAIKIERQVLLEEVRENRAKHKEEAVEAFEGWKKKTLKNLSAIRKQVNEDKFAATEMIDGPPTHHLDEYDRVIAMLEWDKTMLIELGEREFDKYVRDNWSWQESFKLSNSQYTQH
jgi:hypothetical protein